MNILTLWWFSERSRPRGESAIGTAVVAAPSGHHEQVLKNFRNQFSFSSSSMETLELANTVTKKNLHYTILDVKISLKKVSFLIIAEFE